jgi:uncharacterized protein YyaL (SSP411 family)
MERESFEDEEVARLLNRAFVCIKVDREERPDLDNVYMTVSQMMTGTGGWPLTIIMTPDKKPFFAATYIPKQSRMGMSGLVELVPKIEEYWKNRRGELIREGEQMISALKRFSKPVPSGEVDESDVESAYEQLLGSFDEAHGGFGEAPKFPTPHRMLFLLRYWKRSSDRAALVMAERTLEAMRRGGIFDQLGFGFHRYSTDSFWMVPHFEKMLYDQALLTIAYLEAFQATGKKEYALTASQIIEYVLREMTSKEGGFFSSQDADSEGVEGKYYLWTEEEVRNLVKGKDAELAIVHFLGGTKAGPRGEANNPGYVLHIGRTVPELAASTGESEEALSHRIELCRLKLLAERERRTPPAKDDKILADWNGLMIAALARAYAVLGEDTHLAAAERAANFILDKMRSKDGGLLHRFRDGEASIPGFLDDYAFMSWGLIELYQASFNTKYLKEAISLCDYAIMKFWDGENGGFFQTADRGDLTFRMKDVTDGATPSGNSVMAMVLTLIGRLTGNMDTEKKVEEMRRTFSSTVKSYPAQYCFFLLSAVMMFRGFKELVVVGRRGDKETENLIRVARSSYLPNSVLLLREVDEGKSEIDSVSSFVSEYTMREGKATAYLCSNFACNSPANSPEQLRLQLAT